MTHQYKGFVFGHYDSRGGANFIEAETEQQAREQYIAMSWGGLEGLVKDANNWADEPNAATFWREIRDLHRAGDHAALVKAATEEDWIGPATIESLEPIANGADLEYDEEGKLWSNWNPGSMDDPPAIIEFRVADEQPDGFEQSEFGEDAFGLIFNAKA